MNDNITLLDGEEVLEESATHWLGKLLAGNFEIFSTIEYIVTTDRVIRHVDGVTKSTTDEYPIRDIDQLQTEAKNLNDSMGFGTVTFSAGGGGEIVRFEHINDYETFADAIRTRQRELADGDSGSSASDGDYCPNCGAKMLVDPDDNDIKLCPECDTMGEQAWNDRLEDADYPEDMP